MNIPDQKLSEQNEKEVEHDISTQIYKPGSLNKQIVLPTTSFSLTIL